MEELSSTLVPVLRQGIDVLKMILWKELKGLVGTRYPDEAPEDAAKLCAAVLNELFGTTNLEEAHARFAAHRRAQIDELLRSLPTELPALREPLTDALRVQFLCDAEEGIDSEPILTLAAELGLLAKDREVPLPRTFMHLARVLGIAHGILDPRTVPTARE